MRRPAWLLVAVVAALSLAAPQYLPAQEQEYSRARIVRLSFVDGDVQMARPEDEGWDQAIVNMPIQQGYALVTFRGRAEVEFESGATLRMAENTSLQFTDLSLVNGGRITKITLNRGSAIVYANLAKTDSFILVTPGLEVSIPRNARFRMDVTDEGANVKVLKGDVSVESPSGTYRLTKNQGLVFRTDDANNIAMTGVGQPDEFERWAADREEVLTTSRTASLKYVNAPVRYGVAELSSYGNWVYASPYGYVWQPYVGVGWTPYYHGRWVFVAGFGWSWVSYEPWGWLPYHYGRWAHVGFGWVWVPGYFNYWHPGHVVWVQVGTRWGWCPTSPFDRRGRVHHNMRHGFVVNTATGIMTGGRHARLDARDAQPRLVDTPARPDQFGARPRGFAGRTDIDREAIRNERPDRGTAGTGAGPSGFSSASGQQVDRSGRDGREVRDIPDRNPDERRARPAGFSGNAGKPDVRTDARGNDRNDGRNDARDSGWSGRRPPVPRGSIEYDPDTRTYTNKPDARPPRGIDRDYGEEGTPREGNSGFSGSTSRPEPRPRQNDNDTVDRSDRSDRRPDAVGGRRNDPSPRDVSPRSDPAPRGSGGYGSRGSDARPSTPAPAPRMDTPRSSPPPQSQPRYESRPSAPSPSRPSQMSSPRPSAPASSPRMESRPSSPPPQSQPRGSSGSSRPSKPN